MLGFIKVRLLNEGLNYIPLSLAMLGRDQKNPH